MSFISALLKVRSGALSHSRASYYWGRLLGQPMAQDSPDFGLILSIYGLPLCLLGLLPSSGAAGTELLVSLGSPVHLKQKNDPVCNVA